MAGTVKYYLYDPRTKVFMGGLVDGVDNKPAFSTLKEPQDEQLYKDQSMAPFWNEDLQEWELKPDYYGQVFYDVNTLEPVTLLHGEEPDYTKVCDKLPEDPNMVWAFESHSWILPLSIIKEYKRKEIKEAWFKSTGGPYKTGVMGKTVNADTGGEEEVELIINLTENDWELLRQKPFITALELSNSDKVKATKAEIKQLKRGVYVERIMDLIADTLIVIRDYINRYVTIKLSDLDDVLWAQVKQDNDNLRRKWALESIVDSCSQASEVCCVNWNMTIPELEV